MITTLARSAGNMLNADIVSKLVTWATGQTASTVLLLLHLATVVAGGWYILESVVPRHLIAIQAGYDRQEAAHSKQIDQLVASMREDREMYRQVYHEVIVKALNEVRQQP